MEVVGGRLVDQLEWEQVGDGRLTVCLDGVAVVAFECDGSRIVTELGFMDGSRFIDVTSQPEAPAQLLRGAAMGRRCDANAWESAVDRRVRLGATEWGLAELPDSDGRLASTIIASGFPLIRMAMLRGAPAPEHVPRWAVSVMTAASVKQASVSAFGSKSSRRVVRTLPASLLGDSPCAGSSLSLMPLAFAIVLRDLASSDDLANLLSSPTAEFRSQHWPTVKQLEVLRRVFAELGPSAAMSVAVDALRTIEGPQRLLALASQIADLKNAAMGPCPASIIGLEEAVAGLDWEVQPQTDAPGTDEPGTDEPPPIDMPGVPLRAPASPALHANVLHQFRYPRAVRRIDGACVGEHRLGLPRGDADLRMWGRRLRNCAADFAPAVATNQSVVVGVHHNDRLVALLELDPELTRVRQFVRGQNQRPYTRERHAVNRLLHQLGIAVTPS